MQLEATSCWQRLERDAACMLIRVFNEGGTRDNINMHLLLFFPSYASYYRVFHLLFFYTTFLYEHKMFLV